MSIPTRCPVCDAFYNLGEAQRGKRVLCRKCSNTFIVGEGATHSAVRKDALQTSPTPVPPPKSPPPIKPAAIRRDRDDEDERGGGRRDPRRKKAASPLPLILGIGGGLLLLLLLGIGVVMFIAYRMGYGFGSGVVNTTASASARPAACRGSAIQRTWTTLSRKSERPRRRISRTKRQDGWARRR